MTFNPNDPSVVPAIPVQIPEPVPSPTVTVPIVGKAEVAPETLTELEVSAEKERRPVTLVAALGIIAVTLGAVGSISYDLVVNGNSQSLTQLGTFATLGLGGLLALSGTKKGE